jgi:hypothetical protein
MMDMATCQYDLMIFTHCAVRCVRGVAGKEGLVIAFGREGSEVVLYTTTDDAALRLDLDLTGQPSAYSRGHSL